MELTVTQENLNKALNIVGRVASSKSQLPILSNILLRTDNNRLLVAATNLEIATTQHIGAKVVKQGAITIPARLLTDFISNIPKGSVSLKLKNNNLEIESGDFKSTINGVVADEFPELPTINEDTSVHQTMPAIDFKKSVAKTVIAASNDSTRPALTGVYWHSHEKNVYITATDGYRLAETKIASKDLNISAIIPATTLQEVLRTIDDESKEIDILFDDTQVRFLVGETEIISRLIDGKYPDYRQLLPKSNTTKIDINRDDFLRITKLAGLFAKESGSSGGVTLTANKEKSNLSIHSIASQLGENTSVASAKVTEDGKITLNSRYIHEALSVIDNEDIEFSFSGKLAPTVIKGSGDDSYNHIIMPLKS